MNAATSRKSAAAIKRGIRIGDVYDVTNHYITRVDHPSYGTTRRTVVSVNSSGITFDIGGHSYWPRAADITQDGDVIEIAGHPKPGARFLTLRLVERCEASQSPLNRPAKPTNPYPPIESDDAHKIGERKSKYGHAPWVVWHANGKSFAARATAENLDAVLAAIGDGKASLYMDGQGMMGKREAVALWRSNAAIGYLR